jgi:hypothetical protein
MKKLLWVLSLLLFVLASCEKDPARNQPLEAYLIGEWRFESFYQLNKSKFQGGVTEIHGSDLSGTWTFGNNGALTINTVYRPVHFTDGLGELSFRRPIVDNRSMTFSVISEKEIEVQVGDDKPFIIHIGKRATDAFSLGIETETDSLRMATLIGLER